MITTRDCTVNKDKKEFVAYVSDVFGGSPYLDKLLHLESHKSGDTASFKLTGCQYDGTIDNEVVYWFYIPTTDSIVKHPKLRGWKVVLLND